MSDQAFNNSGDVKIANMKFIVNDCPYALSPANPTKTKPIDNGVRLLINFKKNEAIRFFPVLASPDQIMIFIIRMIPHDTTHDYLLSRYFNACRNAILHNKTTIKLKKNTSTMRLWRRHIYCSTQAYRNNQQTQLIDPGGYWNADSNHNLLLSWLVLHWHDKGEKRKRLNILE